MQDDTKVGSLVAEYVQCRKELNNLTETEKTIRARMKTIERDLATEAENQGVEGFKTKLGTVTVKEKLRAAYDPEKWHDIVKWAWDTNNAHIVQRRLTDAKVVELIENDIELPEGLRLDPYTAVSIRAAS